MFARKKKKSLIDQLSGIASIISATIVCIRLTWMGILPVEWATLIMLGVVVLVALGNVVAKLAISALGIWLFCKFVSKGNEIQFQAALGSILALMIVLIGLYVMIRGTLKNPS